MVSENQSRGERPLKVAWFSYFPVEWMEGFPPEIITLPKMHPATWQRVLWEQYRDRRDLELHIFALRGQFRRTLNFQQGTTRFYCVRTPPGMRAGTLYWLDTLILGRYLKKIQPDVVHAWGTEFGSAAISTRLKYPAVVTMQGILTWYGSIFPLSRHLQMSRFLEDRALKKVKLATAESSFAMGYLRERYPQLGLQQVEHAPDPLFARVLRVPQSQPIRFLAVGSFQFWKGADVILKALDRLGREIEYELYWIGGEDANFAEKLRQEVSAGTWRRLKHIRHLSAREIGEHLGSATIFLHAARADNSPNSVKEAVVAGVPVVATRTGGIPDYVEEGKNGLLFESGNDADCLEKIQQALAHPLFSQGAVEGETLRRVRAYLSPERMAAGFHDAYRRAMQR